MNQKLKEQGSSERIRRPKPVTPPNGGQHRWLWPFELKEKIGEGGMGVVYRARFVKNEKEVAVKILPAQFAEDATIAARFKREMEVLKTLKHPHIVHCFGGVCEGEKHFYAMELVEGGSLDALIQRRGKLPWEQAVEYGLQACSALAFAHSHDFVHRDIKPGNFLLADQGQIKLSDFGLAMISSATRLTNAGKTVGSFHYMAPEQIRGNPPVTAQTDLYALGCVLFEMIAGRPPFEGTNAAELLHQHLKNPPPRVSAYALDCPSALEDIINQLLEKDPEQRPADANAVALALRQVSPTKLVDGQIKPQDMAEIAKRSFEEPSTVSKNAKIRQSRVFQGLLVVIVALLAWNVTLQNENRFVERSRELWLDAYRSTDPELRVAGVHALSELSGASGETVDLLVNSLNDKDERVRAAAARSLGRLGPQGRPAVAELIRMQNEDSSVNVRNSASSAVIGIRTGQSPPSNWPYLFWGALAVAGFGLYHAGKRLVKRITEQMPAPR